MLSGNIDIRYVCNPIKFSSVFFNGNVLKYIVS